MGNINRLMFRNACLIAKGILILILTINCSNPKGQGKHSNEKISLEDFEFLENDSISIQKWIPLETTNDNLLGMDLRIKYNDSIYLVMDESTMDCIHVFDKFGKYNSCIARVGEGPNTLPSLNDFDFGADDEILILSSIADKATVYSVSGSGELTEKFSLSYLADSFAYLENGDFLFYGGYNLPYVTHRVVQTSPEGIITDQFLKNEYKNMMLPMTERNFFPADSGIFILESFNPKIFLHSETSLSVYLDANFGSYGIPRRFWEVDIMDGFHMINENGFANFRSIFYQNGLMVTDVMIQREQDVFKYVLFVHGRDRYKLEADRNSKLLWYYPIGIDEKNRVKFVTYKSVLEIELGHLKEQLPLDRLPSTEYDYPVIIHVALTNHL